MTQILGIEIIMGLFYHRKQSVNLHHLRILHLHHLITNMYLPSTNQYSLPLSVFKQTSTEQP